MESHLSEVWIVAIAFYGLAIYTFITSKPMNFWAGHKISSHRIKNVKKYNICLGIMWLFLAIYFSIGSYYEYTNHINMVYMMYQLFIKYILLCMIIYYAVVWYYFKAR